MQRHVGIVQLTTFVQGAARVLAYFCEPHKSHLPHCTGHTAMGSMARLVLLPIILLAQQFQGVRCLRCEKMLTHHSPAGTIHLLLLLLIRKKPTKAATELGNASRF
ncbi:MAG: hypothetical protein HKL99_02370 [Burkholderiales bacterium]|jgi:hypothetical protein|nr:hypothetical protein [Burkholderiales bacterium]